MNISAIKKKIQPILKRNDIKRAAVFGSVARGEVRKNSDIDILIEYNKNNKSLFDFIGLKIELEERLKRKVDLTEYSMIRPRIRSKILNEQVSIY